MPHAAALPNMLESPAARRPIAQAFRRTGASAARTCVRLGISADAVSLASVAAAASAALCIAFAARLPMLLAPAAGLCVLRLWFNMLDGMVAIEGGTASRRGEIMNELPDRLSDIAVVGGIAASGLASPALAWSCAAGALLVAYTGTLGQAVAGRREFGGLMAKPARMAAVAAGCLVTLALHRAGLLPPRFAPLDPWCALILAGCAQSCIVRVRRTLALLEAQSLAAAARDGRPR